MLDLVLTRGVGETTDFDIDDKIHLSDHYVIEFISNIVKLPSLKQRVATRNIKAINTDSFKETVSSLIPTRQPATFDALTGVLVVVLDVVAPCKERTVTARPLKPWFNDNVKAVKREKRRAERAWRKTGLPHHKEAYTK